MHTTTVKMKDGRVFARPMGTFRPVEGWFTLLGNDEKLFFKDVESAITEGERVGYIRDENGKVVAPRIEDVDEVERAREYLRDARKYKWHENIPVQEWE